MQPVTHEDGLTCSLADHEDERGFIGHHWHCAAGWGCENYHASEEQALACQSPQPATRLRVSWSGREATVTGPFAEILALFESAATAADTAAILGGYRAWASRARGWRSIVEGLSLLVSGGDPSPTDDPPADDSPADGPPSG